MLQAIVWHVPTFPLLTFSGDPHALQGASEDVSNVPYIMVVMDDSEVQSLLQSDASVKAFLDTVIKAYGEVAVSLLLIAFKRSLVTKDRRNHTHAVRTGMYFNISWRLL